MYLYLNAKVREEAKKTRREIFILNCSLTDKQNLRAPSRSKIYG